MADKTSNTNAAKVCAEKLCDLNIKRDGTYNGFILTLGRTPNQRKSLCTTLHEETELDVFEDYNPEQKSLKLSRDDIDVIQDWLQKEHQLSLPIYAKLPKKMTAQECAANLVTLTISEPRKSNNAEKTVILRMNNDPLFTEQMCRVLHEETEITVFAEHQTARTLIPLTKAEVLVLQEWLSEHKLTLPVIEQGIITPISGVKEPENQRTSDPEFLQALSSVQAELAGRAGSFAKLKERFRELNEEEPPRKR